MKITRVSLCRVLSLCFVLVPVVHTQTKSDSDAPMHRLAFFVGAWHCNGKFIRSGKSISARLVFEPILDGKFLLFKHDDEPPFSYHAWSEWGWDADSSQFVSTTQDATGHIRLFYSPGWMAKQIVWSGSDPKKPSDQQFVFEHLDDRSFRVSYSSKKDDSWLEVDSSVCSRTGTE